VVAFAKEYGVPVAIKAASAAAAAAMKVARTLEEIPELFESATREPLPHSSRRVLRRALPGQPRHVEAQVIADQHGNVVVAGTRDCSLQRRFPEVGRRGPRVRF